MSEPVNDLNNLLQACNENCHWKDLIPKEMRENLQQANLESGFITLFVGFMVNYTILKSEKLRGEKAYRNLLPYTLLATLRRGVPALMTVLPISPFRCLTSCICDSEMMCKIFALIDHFVAVFEIESLAQICIERFINVLYFNKGWSIPDWHNQLFISISLILASLYSTLPVVGIGSYSRDFNCESCTVNILLPLSDAYKLLVMVFLVLKNVKPVIVMILSLKYASWVELNKIKKDEENYKCLTSSIDVMVKVNILCWFPIFLVRSSVIMAQLLFKNSELQFPPCIVLLGISLHWNAPVFALISFMYYNSRVWNKMINWLQFYPIDSDEPSPLRKTIQPAENKKACDTN